MVTKDKTILAIRSNTGLLFGGTYLGFVFKWKSVCRCSVVEMDFL